MSTEFWWDRLGYPRTRSEDNVKMGLSETGCEDQRWIELAQDRVKWRGLVLALLKLGFSYHGVSYLLVNGDITDTIYYNIHSRSLLICIKSSFMSGGLAPFIL
jgi:hypothetical protein